MREWDALLYLENDHIFEGFGFGATSSGGGEVVFNTGLSGYQEVFTDPSYSKQIVMMTYPHIGNTGINPEDVESNGLYLSGVICREYCPTPSNYRSTQNLSDYLAENKIPAISDVDTREITRILREEGAQRGVIFRKEGLSEDKWKEKGKQLLEAVEPMEGLELVSRVSVKEPYEFAEGDCEPGDKWVVVYDFGVKKNILRHWRKRGFRVKVVPHNFAAADTMALNPAAVMLSNGPGDPQKVDDSVAEIKGLIGKIPIFSICMGHQLLARAIGAETEKLKFGHHGINHPVMDLQSRKTLITSHNHGFAVKRSALDGLSDVELTHVSLNDDCVEGFRSDAQKFMSVQFHPEAASGPHDADYLFDHFIKGFVR